MNIRILVIIIMLGPAFFVPCEAADYAVARISTPVLNTADFKAVFGGVGGKDLKTDRCGQVRELEFIALPGSVFKILKKHRSGDTDICLVETDEYIAPPNVRLYVDGRFLAQTHDVPLPRSPIKPPREQILSALRFSAGSSYVWGGNVMAGIPELVSWYYGGVRPADKAQLTLVGLDCSGLLYNATGGWAPRNTTQLTSYGRGIKIAGKQPAEIASLLRPLDLIVWNGHVIIVLDRLTAIESRLKCDMPGNGGVVMTSLTQRLAEIMRTRRPEDAWVVGKRRQDAFVVRRWHD